MTEALQFEKCAVCDRVKYLPALQGFFPNLVSEPGSEMVKTREYFGSGAAAHRRVVISGKLAAALTKAKVRGASFRPALGH